MRNLVSFRLLDAALVLATGIGAQEKPADEHLIAKIDGSLTANGAFQAVISIRGSGVRSEPYREAFSMGKAVQIRLGVHDDEFILPFQRQNARWRASANRLKYTRAMPVPSAIFPAR